MSDHIIYEAAFAGKKHADAQTAACTYHYDSPLGGITLASDGKALTGLWFDRQKRFAGTLLTEHEKKRIPVFDETVKWLDIYFGGKAPDFLPDLRIITTPFGKAVCEIMLNIPYGKTMSYGQIAARIKEQNGLNAMSAQAVGGAVGRNPIALIIPCHRVVGANGSMTGYGGGIDRKIALLKMEGIAHI